MLSSNLPDGEDFMTPTFEELRNRKYQIIAIADAVRQHVQSCFDHEAELLPLIESAETEAELDAIEW